MFTLPTKARWPRPAAIRPSCTAASVWIVANQRQLVVPWRSVRRTALWHTRAACCRSDHFASDGKVYVVSQSSSCMSYPVPANLNCDACVIRELPPRGFVVPGLIDTHTHAPQFKFAGTGYDMQLLDWLTTYTFPSEAKWSDLQHAARVCHNAVRRTLRHGTTTVSYTHLTLPTKA